MYAKELKCLLSSPSDTPKLLGTEPFSQNKLSRMSARSSLVLYGSFGALPGSRLLFSGSFRGAFEENPFRFHQSVVSWQRGKLCQEVLYQQFVNIQRNPDYTALDSGAFPRTREPACPCNSSEQLCCSPPVAVRAVAGGALL